MRYFLDFINNVVGPDPGLDLKADFFSAGGGLDGLVINLEGVDFLLEIGGVAVKSQGIADCDFSLFNFQHCHLGL